jgi:hypothetical protein
MPALMLCQSETAMTFGSQLVQSQREVKRVAPYSGLGASCFMQPVRRNFWWQDGTGWRCIKRDSYNSNVCRAVASGVGPNPYSRYARRFPTDARFLYTCYEKPGLLANLGGGIPSDYRVRACRNADHSRLLVDTLLLFQRDVGRIYPSGNGMGNSTRSCPP